MFILGCLKDVVYIIIVVVIILCIINISNNKLGDDELYVFVGNGEYVSKEGVFLKDVISV